MKNYSTRAWWLRIDYNKLDATGPIGYLQLDIQRALVKYCYLSLVIVQKARETSTNIPRCCIVGYCTVPYACSSCYTFSFLSSYWKRLEKVKLDNKSLIRCFGVKYRRIFLLVVFILTCPLWLSSMLQCINSLSNLALRPHDLQTNDL